MAASPTPYLIHFYGKSYSHPDLDGQPVQKHDPAKIQQNKKAIHYQPD